MIRKVGLILLVLLQAIAFVGCDETTPIDPALVELYVDLRVASIEYGIDVPEARIARQNLMREAGMTAPEFAEEIEKVRSNPEKWKRFQQQVVERLDTLRSENK